MQCMTTSAACYAPCLRPALPAPCLLPALHALPVSCVWLPSVHACAHVPVPCVLLSVHHHAYCRHCGQVRSDHPYRHTPGPQRDAGRASWRGTLAARIWRMGPRTGTWPAWQRGPADATSQDQPLWSSLPQIPPAQKCGAWLHGHLRGTHAPACHSSQVVLQARSRRYPPASESLRPEQRAARGHGDESGGPLIASTAAAYASLRPPSPVTSPNVLSPSMGACPVSDQV